MSEKERGVVKWFNNTKGFGFIERKEGADAFVHFTSINSEGYRKLDEGQEVEFTVTEGDKGIEAKEVTVIEAV